MKLQFRTWFWATWIRAPRACSILHSTGPSKCQMFGDDPTKQWFQVVPSGLQFVIWLSDLHVFENTMGAKMSISSLMQLMTCYGIPCGIPDSYWFSGTRSEWSPSILMVFGNAQVLDHISMSWIKQHCPTGGKYDPAAAFWAWIVKRVAQIVIIPPQKLFGCVWK